MKRRLGAGAVTSFILVNLVLTVARPLVKTARESLSDSMQDVQDLPERWRNLGLPESFIKPVEALPILSEQVLGLPDEMVEGLVLFTGQDGEGLVETYLEMTIEGLVETGASASNKITLIPVAKRPETVGEGPGGCSSKFKITKADPWEQDDRFYLVVEFIDREGERSAFHANRMSAESMTEWVVDVQEHSELPAPWCGSAVITVYDDILHSNELPSQKHQVQVKVLTSCDCPLIGSKEYGAGSGE